MMDMEVDQPASTPHLKNIAHTSLKRSRIIFGSEYASPTQVSLSSSSTAPTSTTKPYNVPPSVDLSLTKAEKTGLAIRLANEYSLVNNLPPTIVASQLTAASNAAARRKKVKAKADEEAGGAGLTENPNLAAMIEDVTEKSAIAAPTQPAGGAGASSALVLRKTAGSGPGGNNHSLVRRDLIRQPKPDWHPPWELMRVISGHLGWVRALAVEPGNEWFASGAGDRTIKIWDMASGRLKLTLTGHISAVRGLAVSPRHPYLFSCGEDKKVKCWDLETNRVIREYHGHLSGVYTLALHPTLDVLVTGGRDGVARVWDMRTRSNVHVLSGHKQAVADLKCQEGDPQVISASLDATVRLWDLAAGKTMTVLTHHKKGVRGLAVHPQEFTFASASTGSIKQWKCPEGAFMQNFDGHNAIINTLAVNEDNVMFSGGDNGSMCMWDWKTGHRFQTIESVPQPGSLEAEAGIMTSTFDQTGLRLITGEADKTIKVWKPNETATEETHPLQWQPTLGRRKY